MSSFELKVRHPQALVDSAPGHHLKLKNPRHRAGVSAFVGLDFAWATGWRRPFERRDLLRLVRGRLIHNCRVTRHFDTAPIKKSGRPLANQKLK